RWGPAILIGIFSLMAIAYHDWLGGASLWATSAFAFAAVRYERGELTLPRIRLPRRRPRLRVIDGGLGGGGGPQGAGAMEEVDALLDKIARSGISSLTKEQRARLGSARESRAKPGHR